MRKDGRHLVRNWRRQRARRITTSCNMGFRSRCFRLLQRGYSAKGWAPGLIYSNNHHIFVSRSNLFEGFREPIPEFGAPWTHLDTANGEKMPLLHTPIFYVRFREVPSNEVGLEIGMTTQESVKQSSEYRP